MAKPVQGVLADGVYESYNTGYSDGFNRRSPEGNKAPVPNTYWRAYIAGVEDRLLDEEAADHDPLTDEERVEIYGD